MRLNQVCVEKFCYNKHSFACSLLVRENVCLFAACNNKKTKPYSKFAKVASTSTCCSTRIASNTADRGDFGETLNLNPSVRFSSGKNEVCLV
mmetsp:Transcript_1949/g.2240  ORF Transcript_1949/g.2240 Transcript_1949/m.2240 type:complete len:92 (-) Transcript_1949:507-782(-)